MNTNRTTEWEDFYCGKMMFLYTRTSSDANVPSVLRKRKKRIISYSKTKEVAKIFALMSKHNSYISDFQEQRLRVKKTDYEAKKTTPA